jgi:hypothetical protein
MISKCKGGGSPIAGATTASNAAQNVHQEEAKTTQEPYYPRNGGMPLVYVKLDMHQNADRSGLFALPNATSTREKSKPIVFPDIRQKIRHPMRINGNAATVAIGV